MIKAIIIDDEEKARESLAMLIEEYCIEVKIMDKCENLPKGVKAIIKHQPDVVFLDIEMPEHSGLEILDFFEDKAVNFSIIFITAYNEFAIQAIKLSALDYLLKPVVPEELISALKRLNNQKLIQLKTLQNNLKHEELQKIAIPSNNNLILLQIEDIVYMKGEGSYTEIFLNDNTKHMVARNLKKFEELLEHHKNFLRIHRSFYVNFNFVVSFNRSDGGSLNLKNGKIIPVSNEKTQEILNIINFIKR